MIDLTKLLGGSTLPEVRLLLSYIKNNPPWKDRCAVWLCESCRSSIAGARETLREAPWNAKDLGARECDSCGGPGPLLAVLAAHGIEK